MFHRNVKQSSDEHEHRFFVHTTKTEFINIPKTDRYIMEEFAIVICSCPSGPTVKKVKIIQDEKGSRR